MNLHGCNPSTGNIDKQRENTTRRREVSSDAGWDEHVSWGPYNRAATAGITFREKLLPFVSSRIHGVGLSSNKHECRFDSFGNQATIPRKSDRFGAEWALHSLTAHFHQRFTTSLRQGVLRGIKFIE